MNPVKIAESILYDYPCRTEDETSLASAFTGVIISPTEESGVLLLYKGLKKFGNHTESSNESSSGLKTICLPDQYEPDCEVTKTTIGISIRKCSPTEPGSTEPGPAKSGPTEPGPAKSGPTEPGPAKSGPTEPGPAKSGPTEPGPAKSGPAEPGPAKSGPTEPGPAKSGPTKSGSTDIWKGKELECVQVPKGLEGWELRILENTFSSSTELKSGFRYTLETNSHELIVYGHGKDSTAKINAQKHEEDKLKYLIKHIDKKGMFNINKIDFKNDVGLSTLFTFLCDNSKVTEYFQLCINTLIDLDSNRPNSAIGPTARVKCTDMHSLQELPQLLGADLEVIEDIIKLLQKIMPNLTELHQYYNEETKYLESIRSISKNPESDEKESERLERIEKQQNALDNHVGKLLELVRDAADKMWSGPMFTESDGQNYKDSYEKKLRDLINQLVQILLEVRIKSDTNDDIISKLIEDIFRDQRYAGIPPEERHFYPLYKELQKLCWVMGELVDIQETTITTITESVSPDGSRNKLAKQQKPKIHRKETTTTTESETKLDKLFQQYKDGNMGGDWFGNLISLAKQLLNQWKQFVEKKEGGPSNVDCEKLKKKMNLKDDETAKKLVKRWFNEGEGPLSIMKVEWSTTNASVRYYCWSGTLDYEDPFYTHNDTHIPLTMHGRGNSA